VQRLITRRVLLSNGLKTGLGLAILETARGASPVLISDQYRGQADRSAAAYLRLDAFITRHMSEIGAPGMTVALADRRGLLRASQYGFADLKKGLRVAPETLFEIGSISKSFVAMAIVQLAEEGKLDLHKPVRQYLPWLKIESNFAPFTTHHLLSHTSGLSGVPLLQRVAAQTLRTGSEPGTQFVYCNIGYVLLGLLLETIEKRAFDVALRARVLRPLGMNASEPVIANSTRNRMAVGYSPLFEDRPFPLKGKLGEAPWLEVPEAAGSVAATARDMGNYLSMLLNRGMGPGERVLTEKGFALFTKPVIKALFRGEDASYAYGLWTSDIKGNTLLRHTGGMVAFSSAMYADVTDGFAVFASVNARMEGYRPVAVARYALDLLSAAAGGKELPALPPPPPAPDIIKNAAEYAGIYTGPDDQKLLLTNEGEHLMLHHNGRGIVLEGAGRDRFIVKHPDFELFTLGFGRDKNDAIVETFHGEQWWASERYVGPKIFGYPTAWNAFTGHYRSDSPWYGSARVVIRKGALLLDGEQELKQIEPGVFRSVGATAADWVAFDTMLMGKANHVNYSGIDYYRTFTP
jgi:CubicO group peptidase (beta-lactamase class C family)